MSAASREYLEYCADYVQRIEDGLTESLGLYFELSEMEKQITAIKEQVLPYAVNDASAYDKKELAEMGITYIADGRPKYDYKHIAEWSAAKAQLENIEKAAKANGLAKATYSKPIIFKTQK